MQQLVQRWQRIYDFQRVHSYGHQARNESADIGGVVAIVIRIIHDARCFVSFHLIAVYHPLKRTASIHLVIIGGFWDVRECQVFVIDERCIVIDPLASFRVFALAPLQLLKLFPGIHLEPTRSSYTDNYNYFCKIGSDENVAKSDTSLCPVYSWGDYHVTPADDPESTKQSIWDYINSLLEEGLKPAELYQMDVRLAYYANAIECTYLSRKKDDIPIVRDIVTTYHVGESQQGKSFTLVKLAEQYGYENIHWVSGDYAWIFDGYEYQDILVLDEFRDDKIKFSVLLSILDKYPLRVNVKNSHASASYTQVHITSVLAPKQLYIYEDLRKNDTRQQLYNRIHFIVYHWKDDDRYHEFEIPFSDYVDYANLVYRAKKSREIPGAQQTPTEEAPLLPSCGQLVMQTPLVRKLNMLAEQAKRFVYEQVCNEIEPEPRDFKKNPFISFDFSLATTYPRSSMPWHS